MAILGVDIGTTSMKMGVYRDNGDSLTLERTFEQRYSMNTYNNGLFSDIEPDKWKKAFADGCSSLQDLMPDVDVIALSGTTPGLTAMDKEGNALYPAIVMLDQRSRVQAQRIIKEIGLNTLLSETGNMPVAGGCSLASILWIKDNYPELFNKTRVFGHSNTYVASLLTGNFAIDPSSASLMTLYNTVRNDFTWNEPIAKAFGLSLSQLPELIQSHQSPGRVKQEIAARFGLKKVPHVVIGGNDAVLAAYSIGIKNPGEIINVSGTCEITLVCLPACLSSVKYNVRAHVIPDRWLTLYVMNAGGKAYEWFQKLCCSEMSADVFYDEFIPKALDQWLERESGVTYVPYLMGSRYSLEELKAGFLGLTPESGREELLTALVRGLCEYQREHLKEIGNKVQLNNSICLSGGAVSPAIIRAKKNWMQNCEYIFEEQSSLKGAALLGQKFLKG